MTKTFEEANRSEEAVDDDISVYVNNMGRKLRKIRDVRTLVLVQNEMDQVIFRATMGMYDNQPPQSHVQNTPSPVHPMGMYDNQPLQSHVQNTHSPVHRQMQIVTSTPTQQNWSMYDNDPMQTLLHLLVSLTPPCWKYVKKKKKEK